MINRLRTNNCDAYPPTVSPVNVTKMARQCTLSFFVELPLELRSELYGYIDLATPNCAAILGVSKQVREEALPVLFGTICLEIDANKWFSIRMHHKSDWNTLLDVQAHPRETHLKLLPVLRNKQLYEHMKKIYITITSKDGKIATIKLFFQPGTDTKSSAAYTLRAAYASRLENASKTLVIHSNDSGRWNMQITDELSRLQRRLVEIATYSTRGVKTAAEFFNSIAVRISLFFYDLRALQNPSEVFADLDLKALRDDT